MVLPPSYHILPYANGESLEELQKTESFSELRDIYI